MQNTSFTYYLSAMTMLASVFLAVAAFLPFQPAYAQSSTIQTGITIEASPAIPAPFQQVDLRLRSVNTDLSRAPIVWIVDGVERARGVGQTTLTVTVGDLGSATNVRAITQSAIGAIEKTTTLTPTEVDILWEAPDAYTPPFYKGKALPAPATLIRVVAVPTFISPSGARLDSGEMVYRWKRNHSYRDFNDESGYGAHTISFILDRLRVNELLEVEISSFGEALNGRAGVVLDPRDPHVRIYEKHPLRGVVYERALEGGLTLPESSEVALVAEPFFFDFFGGHSDLTYEWQVNGNTPEDTGGDNPNEIVLQTSAGEGEADVDISIDHVNRLFQSARHSLDVVFGGQPAGGGFFGF